MFHACLSHVGSCPIQQLTSSSTGRPAGWSPFLLRVGRTRNPERQAVVLAVQPEPLNKDCSTSLELARGWPARCVGRLGSDLPAEAHAGTASRDGWEMTEAGIGPAAPAWSAVITQPPAFCRYGLFSSAKEVLGLAQGDCLGAVICLGAERWYRGEKSSCNSPKIGWYFCVGGVKGESKDDPPKKSEGGINKLCNK